MSTEPYIIIGCGLSGVSSALEILKANPDADLTIFSYHHPEAPSYDKSKVFRIDYPSLQRMKSVISTRDDMMKDELIKPFLRRVGRIVVWEGANLSTLDAINSCRSQLGLKKREPLEMSVLNQFYNTSHTPSGRVHTYHDDDILLEWEGLMNAMVCDVLNRSKKSKEQTMRQALVEKLIWEGERVTELRLAGGERVDSTNTRVVLAAGPWTCHILNKSGINQPTDSRAPVAAAIFSYFLRIPEHLTEFFEGKPIISDLGNFEFTPPIEGTAKLTNIMPFTNKATTSSISLPTDLQNSALAGQCMFMVEKKVRTYIPALNGVKIIKIKSCWDGITKSQEPLIGYHPDFNNLVLACGLSFTHGKDIYIGRKVVDVFESKDKGDGKYGFDAIRPSATDNQPLLLPPTSANFEALERSAEKDKEVGEWKKDRGKSQDIYRLCWK